MPSLKLIQECRRSIRFLSVSHRIGIDRQHCPRNTNARIDAHAIARARKSGSAIGSLIKTSAYLSVASRLLFSSRLNVIDWTSRRKRRRYLILCPVLNPLLVLSSFIFSYILFFFYISLSLPLKSSLVLLWCTIVHQRRREKAITGFW